MTNESSHSNIEFSEVEDSQAFLKNKLQEKQAQLSQLTAKTTSLQRANLQHDIAEIMLDIADAGMPEAAWGLAKEAFKIYLENEDVEAAVQTLDCLYRTQLPSATVALGHALWLSVTYPIDPELSIAILKSLIDDTPAKSDGAAVAAVTAHYLADLRLTDKKRESVMFLTTNLIAQVAERHSQISDQAQLNFWMDKLELNDPQKFLPRLAQVIDAIVAENWWFDKDQLRAKLPTN